MRGLVNGLLRVGREHGARGGEGVKENENESLFIPAVHHDIYHYINCKIKIDLRLT